MKSSSLAAGAVQLPMHHITIRVPWHDRGWSGTVCASPGDNSSCLVLPRIGQNKNDAAEEACAGSRLDKLRTDQLPPCFSERVAFMSPFELGRTIEHPYSQTHRQTHGHLARTPFSHPPYSASCVPFRWMLRDVVAGRNGESGLAEKLQLGWEPEREPKLRFDSAWIQERENQLASLDTFFGALRPQESLCFFYAKRTPLSEQFGRVIVGVGRVLTVGPATEYRYSTDAPPARSMIWDRNINHSIRPDFKDGFLLPYQEIHRLALSGEIVFGKHEVQSVAIKKCRV